MINAIYTKRLIIRPLVLNDLDDFYEYAKNPEVGPMAGWAPHKNKEQSLKILKSLISLGETQAIALRNTGKVIGSIGVHMDHCRMNPNARTVGYVLSEPYWGNGFMTESVKAVTDFVFEGAEDVNIISAYCIDFNTPSKKLLEKCGFTFDGVLKQGIKLYDGHIFDLFCYSILKSNHHKYKK